MTLRLTHRTNRANIPPFPAVLSFDAATPHQISVRVEQTRALHSNTFASVYCKTSGSGSWINKGFLHRIKQTEVGETINEGFAGWIIDCIPGTTYDVRTDIVENGVTTSTTTTHTTRALPIEGSSVTKTCTPATFLATLATVVAGDTLLLQNGTYTVSDNFSYTSPGTAGSPVVIRGESRTGVIWTNTTATALLLNGSHTIIEDITFRGAQTNSGPAATSRGIGFTGARKSNITIRRCTFDGFDRGIKAYDPVDGLLVYECEFLGNNAWETLATDDPIGNQYNDDGVGFPGQGNCVWNCTFQGHGDVLKTTTGSGNTERSRACYAHHNWVKWSGDDFFEMDDVGGNICGYNNVVCNTTTAISAADTYGGPVGLIRNVFINQARHPLKLNGTSQGARILNNTFVSTTKIRPEHDHAIYCPFSTNYQLDFRNNIVTYRGTGDTVAFNGSSAGLPGFVINNNGWYPNRSFNWSTAGAAVNLAAAKTLYAPQMSNDVVVTSDPFETDITLGADYSTKYTGNVYPKLEFSSAAKNAGVEIDGVTDGYSGLAPDIGAVISGQVFGTVGCSWNSELTVAPWAPVSGTIANISLNTRVDINPANDPLANPNYPLDAPWEDAGYGWHTVAAYCGAVMAEDIGSKGTYLQYGGAGHAAVNATFMFGFDLDDRLWKRIQKRPLPTDSLGLAAADQANFGSYYSVDQLDSTWGNWKGDYSGWGSFAQPGYNPPVGGHTRNSWVYRPASAVGNTSGQVITAWHDTGRLSGTGSRGSHIWDADTGNWSHTTNLRPNAGSSVGGIRYFPHLDAVIGMNLESSSSGYQFLDVLDCSTMTWSRRTLTNGIDCYVDATCFACDDLYVFVSNVADPGTPMLFYGIEASKIKDGISAGWTPLNISAASYPLSGTTDIYLEFTKNVQWEQCPIDGNFYAVNRLHGSNKLWKLVPPPGNTAAKLAGTWTITEQTLTGETLDCRISNGTSLWPSFDYSRLRWSTWANAFIWTSDYNAGNVQAIRPQGV